MEMVKEENVVEEKAFKAGMDLGDEFNVWFAENRKRIRKQAFDPQAGDEDTYYQFAHFISNFCLEEFCAKKGISKEDVEDGFTYPVIAAELFLD